MRKVPCMLLHGGFLPLRQPSEGTCNSVAICAKTGLRRCQHCLRRWLAWWLRRRGRGGMGLAGSAQHAVGVVHPHVAPGDDSPRHVLWPRIPLIVLGHQAAGPFLPLPCSRELVNRVPQDRVGVRALLTVWEPGDLGVAQSAVQKRSLAPATHHHKVVCRDEDGVAVAPVADVPGLVAQGDMTGLDLADTWV